MVNVVPLWRSIRAPVGVELYLAQRLRSFAGILTVADRQLHHPEYNAVQIQVLDCVPRGGCLVNVYIADDTESAPGCGVSLKTDLEGILAILPDLASHVDVHSIHHLNLTIAYPLDGDATAIVCHALRPFTSVDSLTLQTNNAAILAKILCPNVIADIVFPTLRSLSVQLVYATYEVEVDDSEYMWRWERVIEALKGRARLEKPIYRLQLVGNWRRPNSSQGGYTEDVDRAFVKRARLLVTELIDSRT